MIKLARIAIALTFASAAIQSHATSVSLGAGSQNLTLYGQGAVSPGVGGFRVGQGSSSFDGTTSTFTFSGAITGGDPGFNSGTYSFVTKYLGANTPNGGLNAPIAQSNPGNLNFFYYDFLDSSTTIDLFLNTLTQNYDIPLVTGGAFVPGTGFSFLFTSPTCTGVTTCSQNNVGLTPGATISGPVTISASFTVPTPVSAVPEPATWLLMLTGFGAIGVATRRRRKAINVFA